MRGPPIALFASILLFATTLSGASETPEARGIVARIKREPIQSTALASVGST